MYKKNPVRTNSDCRNVAGRIQGQYTKKKLIFYILAKNNLNFYF